MLGDSDRIDLYCRITSGIAGRRLKTKVDKLTGSYFIVYERSEEASMSVTFEKLWE